MVPNVDEASTSDNVFNECLDDAYYDASTSFHDSSNVHTFCQPYPHEKKWTKDHPLHKIIGDPKSGVRKRGQLANSCLFSCLLGLIEPVNAADALRDADWDFTVFQMDVKTAFLNGILKEEVYVGQPPGLWDPKDSGFDQTAYSDADHAGCHLDRKSLWDPKDSGFDQTAYSDADHAGCHLDRKMLWMRTQLTDYGFFYDKVPIYCDSKSAIAISCNLVQHTRTKHIDMRRNRTLVEAARTMLTFAHLPSFLWDEAIATACFTQNRSIINKCFDKTPYELINKRKPNIKFFRVFGCRCYLLNDNEDVGKLKAKGDIGVIVGYSKESIAFRIYNKQIRKIHESVNVNFDEISEMASKQFSLEPGLSNINETGKALNRSVSKVDEALKNDLEDLFQDFYDEYFDSLKIMKSSTTNVETSNAEIPLHGEEVFHEVSESFQMESSSSSLNDNVQQSPEEVIPPQINTQSIPINMVPNG
nr:retrovirus-related Pol polyprotein from transposon TNT 1-94 [Tanacetum cinerariifolium]